MQTAGALVGTVRGRRLCYELAQRGSLGQEVRCSMGREAERVDEERGNLGRSSVFLISVTADGSVPVLPPARALGEVLTAAAPAVIVHAGDLLAALSRTVASAMYWQPPDAEDIVLARPAIRAALLPIAELVVGDRGARWWSTLLDRGAQVRTRFEAARAPVPQGTPSERLRRWRDAVVEQERSATSHGGAWWVTPALAGLDLTTRALGEAGSVALWATEDELGWAFADLTPCAIDPAARVLEIDGPDAWASLVATYPLEVTSSRGPGWWDAVDPHDGDWAIPDWSAVATEYDGVHVSVLAWLTTSGQAVPVGPGTMTTLAGWDPDATWWLTDAVHEVAHGRRWVRDDLNWLPSAVTR